jgi:hypothetical protein
MYNKHTELNGLGGNNLMEIYEAALPFCAKSKRIDWRIGKVRVFEHKFLILQLAEVKKCVLLFTHWHQDVFPSFTPRIF